MWAGENSIARLKKRKKRKPLSVFIKKPEKGEFFLSFFTIFENFHLCRFVKHMLHHAE